MALEQQQQLDDFTTTWLSEYRTAGKVLYCKKGCFGCCHLAVHAAYPEASAVAAKLTEQQLRVLADYIDRLRAALPQLTSLKTYLKQHREGLGPCPFLDTGGSCSIYPIRPLSCRSLLSTRPASWCTVDFAELDSWDKQMYENGLDRQVVAWPTHFVAATQDFGQQLETQVLETMQKEQGWALSGNFPLLVWLATQCAGNAPASRDHLDKIIMENRLNSEPLLNFSG